MAKEKSKVSVPEQKNETQLVQNLQSSRYQKDEYAKMSDGMVP